LTILKTAPNTVGTKWGKDGWCLKELELFINEASYYREKPDCRWIDGDDGHEPTYTIPGNRLHAVPNHFSIVPGQSLTRQDVTSLVESAVGHAVTQDTTLSWGELDGSVYIDVTRKDRFTYHVDLDLTANLKGDDPEVDMDFDIYFQCRGTQLTVAVRNPKVSIHQGWMPSFEGLLMTHHQPLMDFAAARLRNSIDFRRVNRRVCDVQIDRFGGVNIRF
jgi:hypothetical protein